ncbi:MAG: AraC family transcriptional regulator [Rubrivivax sp.]|nr:AraC family transcriptional regulator [Rubrivivax sp.]
MAERLYLRLEDDPLYAPETTVPQGTLREFAVPAALRDEVAHVLAYDETLPEGVQVRERVLPDGALRLIVDLQGAGAAGGTANARIAGPGTRPVLLTMQGRQQGLSVTLRPGAALALFGLPAHELAGCSVPWEALVPAGRRDLAARLCELPGDAARVRFLLATLRGLARGTDAAARQRALRAAALLRRPAADEAPRIAAVARSLGLGERRLQQIFRAQIGLSPRAWARLARLHACLRALRAAPGPRWAEVAAAGGFYDQSHLVNEFRALCGLTPAQFVRRAVSGSSKTAG